MIGDRTYKWARRIVTGTSHYKGINENTLGYTETRKMVSAASATAVRASAVMAAAGGSFTTSITNPDVPRALSITTGGTTGDVRAGIVEIHGTNVEGAVIHEELALTENQNGATNGVKAFKTVTSIDYPPMDGAAAELSVGTQNKLGVNHRLPVNETTVKVYSATAVGGALTLQAAPALSLDESNVEQNLVTPATLPDGTTFLTVVYTYDDWAASRTNDNPTYWDATSTSTSTTTATTTTTSTSSTSSSTSSTSTSSTSTSISTSSTSTSTTTTP
jgi:hypothetical protein